MKPILSIADLVKNPSFGVNVIISESISKIEEAVVLDYSLDARKVTLHIAREYPNRPGVEVKQHLYLARTLNPANKAFFEKLEEGAFHVHGDLQSDDIKEEFTPLYEAHLKETLGYGEDAQIEHVTYGKEGGVAQIRFNSLKSYTTYDEAGEPTVTKKRKQHNARWTLLDPSVDYNNTVVIPRPLFETAPQFLRLVAETIDVDINRIFLKNDPTDAGIESVLVYFDPSDLVYAGSIPVTIPPAGDAIHVYNNTTGLEVEGEGSGEEGGETTDPVDPPAGGTGEGNTQPPAPTPVISDLEYDPETHTLTGLVTDAVTVTIKVNDGAPINASVVEGVLSHMFNEALPEGAVIVVTAGEVSESITLPVAASQ